MANREQDELLTYLNEWNMNTRKIQASTPHKVKSQSCKVVSKSENEISEQRKTDARSIFLRNIPVDISINLLEDHFKLYGTINRVTIFTNRKTFNLGYAYIEFEEDCSADQALDLNNSELCGHKIEVTKKRTNLPGIRRKPYKKNS
ncbi:Sgn1p [Lachancea thermotolerans CBS 6340]|uniref:KLTH0F13090p n=1 Tax=Lachancea thermotolerans (strain ATCC 56472 / CBS 6340 / NRRL Y-8284) TaxID=559295 RepID=C5DJ32_LACTC|nr:KLTH0F13090p [Lachancea thermotolerans CBS 6340]CAR24321.1 KLTH0F13090p [Lachancea thermotolerans CBS 6340]